MWWRALVLLSGTLTSSCGPWKTDKELGPSILRDREPPGGTGVLSLDNVSAQLVYACHVIRPAREVRLRVVDDAKRTFGEALSSTDGTYALEATRGITRQGVLRIEWLNHRGQWLELPRVEPYRCRVCTPRDKQIRLPCPPPISTVASDPPLMQAPIGVESDGGIYTPPPLLPATKPCDACVDPP